MLIFCLSIEINSSDTGKNPGFMNVQSTIIFAENLKGHLIPPNIYLGGSEGTDRPENEVDSKEEILQAALMNHSLMP